jgi:hypothetical protein
MQSISGFALFGLFAAVLLAGGLSGLFILLRRPPHDPYDAPFGDVPRRRE